MTTKKLDILMGWFDDFGTVSGHSGRTKTARERTIRRISREGIDTLTCESQVIISWLASLGVSPASKATYRAHLAAWFSWLHLHQHRGDNPMRLVPKMSTPRGLPRPLAASQIHAALDVCRDFRARHTRAYILFGWLAGLRNHEIAALHGRDFNLDLRQLTVVGKGGRQAIIPLHPALADLACHYPEDDWFFPSTSPWSQHISRVSVGTAISRAFDRAGIVATPHQLRHSFGTAIYQQSRDLGLAQVALRHADIRTTRIYAQVSDSRLEEAVSAVWQPKAA